jgi:hypothetical protein
MSGKATYQASGITSGFSVIRPQSAIPQWTFQLPITGLLASLVGIHIYE